MELQIVPLIIVVAYLVGMMLVGFIVGKLKIKDSNDYMLAGRRMGLFMVAFSLSANNIGGGSTTGLAQKAFGEWGMSAIWYVLAASVAMIPLAYFAPKIRKTMAVTIPEVVGRRFGKGSSVFTAVLISMLGVSIVTMNTFAFGIRCAGPFAAYGLGLVVPNATRHSGIASLAVGTIGFCFWQFLSGGDFLFGILPVVFGCACGVIAFFVVNLVEWKKGVAPAPAAYVDSND